MKRFMLKSFLLASIMFICVLFGMQQANEGIYRMKGYDDTNLGKAFTFTEGEEGKLQAHFLGKDVTSHDIQKKKQELEKMNSFNFFSSSGKKIADGISNAADKTLHFFTNTLEK
jgi:hypothetical protein